MKGIRKSIIALCFIGLLVAPAWANTIPEFDAVGCDSSNAFAMSNYLQYIQAIELNYIYDSYGYREYLNDWSDFTYGEDPLEFFEPDIYENGFPDPCFPGLDSVLTTAWNAGVYTWQIVLQLKPESDINVSIYDCVLATGWSSPWGYDGFYDLTFAEQTGRFLSDWEGRMFIKNANPIITVTAMPGTLADPDWAAAYADNPEPLIMDARTLPELNLTPLDGKLYTSKAVWDESLVLALPKSGGTNVSGQTMPNLHQGDMLNIKVEIPTQNRVDIRYGADSVILKYIGIAGTWYFSDYNCYGNSSATSVE